MLTAIYGGAFDPVHNGHIAVALAAAAALDAQVRLMPTGDARHRSPAYASGAQRLQMLRLAIEGYPGLSIDTREIERAGATYSIDTLIALRIELGPSAPIAMIVGADAFMRLATWHRWRELFGLAHFVVAERPGAVLPDSEYDARPQNMSDAPDALIEATRPRWVAQAQTLRNRPAGHILKLRLALRPESSSAIRARLRTGESVAGLVPEPVEAYLREHRLYLAVPAASTD